MTAVIDFWTKSTCWGAFWLALLQASHLQVFRNGRVELCCSRLQLFWCREGGGCWLHCSQGCDHLTLENTSRVSQQPSWGQQKKWQARFLEPKELLLSRCLPFSASTAQWFRKFFSHPQKFESVLLYLWRWQAWRFSHGIALKWRCNRFHTRFSLELAGQQTHQCIPSPHPGKVKAP